MRQPATARPETTTRTATESHRSRDCRRMVAKSATHPPKPPNQGAPNVLIRPVREGLWKWLSGTIPARSGGRCRLVERSHFAGQPARHPSLDVRALGGVLDRLDVPVAMHA